MKRIVAWILSVVLVISVLPVSVAAEQVTEVPEGYVGVYTKDDLYAVRNNVSGKYILMNDIVFDNADFEKGGDFYNAGKGWAPIGTKSTPFTGTFDGNGYTIYNLYIYNPTGDYQGLFGYLSGGSVAVSNVFLMEASITGQNYVGGICGYIFANTEDPEVQKCSVSGRVKGDKYIGGICGYISVDACDSITVQYCSNAANVSGSKAVGGIVGYAYTRGGYISVNSCANTGNIQADSYAGGIVGRGVAQYETTSYGYNYDGVVWVDNCLNVAEINGISHVGEMFGGVYEDAKDSGVGASYCYSVSNVLSIVGENSDIAGISFCYYLDDEGGEATNGTPKSSDQLKKQGTFEQWNFNTVWTMEGREDYPYPELQGVDLIFQIDGNAEIQGTPAYGEDVTADFASITPADVKYSFEWLVDGESVSTDKVYSISEEDIGKTLQFKITSLDDGVIGSLYSDKVTMTKAQPTQTLQPAELQAKSDTTISVKTVDGQVYSLDGETWQDSGDFVDLTPNTAYTVYTTVPETATHYGTEVDSSLQVTTDKTQMLGAVYIEGEPVFGQKLTVDVSSLAPSTVTYSYEWRRDGEVVSTDSTYTVVSADIGCMLSVAVIGTDNSTGEIESAAVEAMPCDINDLTVQTIATQTYTGQAFTPNIVLKNGAKTLVKDVDYSLIYLNNISVGTAKVLIYGNGNYTGNREVTFKIIPRNISALTYSAIDVQNYTGDELKPSITIAYGDYTLVENMDYTVEYMNNVNPGVASVLIVGKGNYQGAVTKSFTVSQSMITDAIVTTQRDEYAYTGAEVKPEVTVTLGNKTLTFGIDYTTTFGNNIKEGQGMIVVKGIGGYKGEKTVNFTISGHIYGEWTVRTEPTCTQDGIEYHICSGCNGEETRPIPKKGHAYKGSITQEPTCSAEGVTTYICDNCGDSYTEPILKISHTHSTEWTVDVEPTCTEVGSKSHHCTACGDKADVTEIEALGHDFSTEWTVDKEPTCTEVGSKSHHCTVCGDKADVTELPALEHDFTEWTEEKAPTSTEVGTEMRSCNKCHAEERRDIPKLDVDFGNVDGKDGITANDALMALQAATGKIGLDDVATANADVDGADGITANDALLILQYATKKITAFPKAG